MAIFYYIYSNLTGQGSILGQCEGTDAECVAEDLKNNHNIQNNFTEMIELRHLFILDKKMYDMIEKYGERGMMTYNFEEEIN